MLCEYGISCFGLLVSVPAVRRDIRLYDFLVLSGPSLLLYFIQHTSLSQGNQGIGEFAESSQQQIADKFVLEFIPIKTALSFDWKLYRLMLILKYTYVEAHIPCAFGGLRHSSRNQQRRV